MTELWQFLQVYNIVNIIHSMNVDVTDINTTATGRHGCVSTPQRKVWSRADSSGNTDIRIGQH